MCFNKVEVPILFDNLGRPLDNTNINHTLWNDKCDYIQLPEARNLNHENKNLIILQLNIRSLLGKQEDLNRLLSKLSTQNSLPKLLILSETHMNSSKLRHFNVPNYKILSRNRENKLGGGVAILSHVTQSISHRSDFDKFNTETLECIFAEIPTRHKKPIIIGSIYRPPNTNAKEFNNQYNLIIKALSKEKHKEIIIGMDHNLDLLKSNSHKDTQKFIDINFEANILPCITRPTRITKSTATLIDNVFVSQYLHKAFDSAILLNDISDHLPSLVIIQDQFTEKTDHWNFNCRSLTEPKMTEINNLLFSTDWTTLKNQDVNKSFSRLQTRIEECMNAVAPLKTMRIPMHKAWREPWVTKGISNSMNHCNHLYKKSLHNNAKHDAENRYKIYRNCLTKIKRIAKTNYYKERCYALKSNTKRLWQLINNIINKNNDKTTIIDHITVGNIRYYDAKDISDQFGIYYSELGGKLSKKLHGSEKAIKEYLTKIKPNPKSLFLKPITKEEIQKYINKLPSKNSSGYDQISNILIKRLETSITEPLCTIFNQSLQSGIFPESMKIAEIIPLFKRGPKQLIENYRPISLLITMSKLLEKCIYHRVYKFLDNNNIFFQKQYGFRAKHSCEHAIQDLCGNIINNKDQGLKSAAIFLDLSKAFDTIPHDILLKKLEIYGIRGLCNKWFESYLTNRTLQVKCKTLSRNNVETSKSYQLTHGTAQGSCLGPLLFNIFCNDIQYNIEKCNLILFADDTTIYASHRNATYLNYILQQDFDNLQSWFKANLLTLNTTKTVTMNFWPEQMNKEIKINTSEEPLPSVTSTRFLGVTIDNELTWHPHINNLISKISVNKLLLSKAKHLMNQESKKLIYYAHIYSHLTYANTVWSTNISKKQKKRIEKIQKHCIRSISRRTRTSHTDPLFKQLKIIKFDDIVRLEQCKLAYKIKNRLMPTPILELFNTLGKKTHRYNTRQKSLPNIKRHKSELYNKSFLCKSIAFYNTISNKIRNTPNLKEFINMYKKRLLDY